MNAEQNEYFYQNCCMLLYLNPLRFFRSFFLFFARASDTFWIFHWKFFYQFKIISLNDKTKEWDCRINTQNGKLQVHQQTSIE